VAELKREDVSRCRDLMGKYRSLPMDFADATLVVLAEKLKTRRVFTLDSDFRVYRIGGRRAFEVVPEV
jgi:predicted nucleic acid-binding protein